VLLHPKTKDSVNAYIGKPNSTLLIETAGDELSYSVDLAKHIYSSIAGSSADPVLEVQSDKSIGIEAIRDLIHTMSLSANKSDKVSRAAIIHDAHLLTREAQNSLLKLIEELPSSTQVMLVASNSNNLFSTIKSRCYSISILPINKSDAATYAEKDAIEASRIDQAYLVSEGKPGLFLRLIADDEDEYFKSINVAKQYIGSTVFERQQMAKTITDKKFNLDLFLQSLKVIAKSGIHRSKTTEAKLRWSSTLEQVLDSKDKIDRNVNKKLALLELSVHL
jgi:DNA polymerase III delta prime subunit